MARTIGTTFGTSGVISRETNRRLLAGCLKCLRRYYVHEAEHHRDESRLV